MSYNQETKTYEFYSKVDLPSNDDEEGFKRKSKNQESKKVSHHAAICIKSRCIFCFR